jgi:dTDP-4-amino-4,6-dideoxygalactose transaminase
VQASYQIALEEFDSLALQGVPSGAEVNGWLQGVRVTSRARCDRDALLASLDARGIDARAVFQPMHRQAMFRACGGACPAAEDVADTALNLPNGPDTDVPRVIRALREVL